MSLSPTQRTLRELRAQGRIAGIVERWNRFAGSRRPDGEPVGVRQDLFGFIDIIALDTAVGIIAIQSCSGTSHAKHFRKICEDCYVEVSEWLRCGGRVELWSWSKRRLRPGAKALRWKPRIQVITEVDLCTPKK